MDCMKRSDSSASTRNTAMNTNTMPKLNQMSSCFISNTVSTYSFTVMWSIDTGVLVTGWHPSCDPTFSYAPSVLFHVGNVSQSVNTSASMIARL
uniref:Uncharacterized protein n=1 Tax=Globisporangium ultimum (strain ATCC 200006 / CBS 805.95 / DAOM BR144) TaxID=431595 RepID=K3WZL8_GLOUD